MATDTKTTPTSTANLTEDPIQPGADKEVETPKNKRLLPIFGLVVLIALIVFGVRYVLWSQTHISTDDAQVQSDVIQISPQVSGTVLRVLVEDNQRVKAGDELAELDPTTYQAAVDQAQADLDAAIAQNQGALANVALTDASGSAVVQEAAAGLQLASTGIATSLSDLNRVKAAERSSMSLAEAARQNVLVAIAQEQAAVHAKSKAIAALEFAEAQVAVAKSAIGLAKSQLTAAQATSARADRDAKRLASLFAQGAVSASSVDQARASAEVARAQLEAAGQSVTQASANLQAQLANEQSAQSQVDSSSSNILQADATVHSLRSQAQAAQNNVLQATAQRQMAGESILNAKAKVLQSKGALEQAQTAPRQVSVSKAAQSQAAARIEQARAVLTNAKINLQRTKIFAPVSGIITHKSLEVGSLVSVGMPLMSLVPNEDPWVIANFKETQLANIKVGQPVEIEVDGLPGKVLKGKVDSLSSGTGATFALLPPDNATGNFTKVVQRVPLKIVFESGQPELSHLVLGMSVTATIDTK